MAARFTTVGDVNQNQFIQLKSQFDIGPASALVLPIEVNPRGVSLYGRLPPRLVSIDSASADNVYGAGAVLSITLNFVSDVLVINHPTLTVNTGCHSDACKVVEIQSFICRADQGAFSLRLNDQVVSNINVNTTRAQFATMLAQIAGILNVSVTYTQTSPSNPYDVVDRICSSAGNNVTVYFWNVSLPQFDGNVPQLEFDVNNRFIDDRDGSALGNGDYLRGVHESYVATINATTIQQGHQQRDGLATYLNGSGTNLVEFEYIVRVGDSTGNGILTVLSINFDNGSIVSPLTLEPVSTTIPDFASGQRFRSNISAILGYNRNIVISFAHPQVVLLSSTVPNGIYTLGDVIPIFVTFDFPVKVYGGANIYLVLSTGQVINPSLHNRNAYFTQSFNSTTLVFDYLVQQGDTSPRLDVLNADSLVLNGGFIYLDNGSNVTAASLTLPTPGSVGSLSASKDIVIDTQAPIILGVQVVSPNRTYTAGDEIFIDVIYSSRIAVFGSPILWLQNNVNSLNATIIDVPAFPTYGKIESYFISFLKSILFSICTSVPGVHFPDCADFLTELSANLRRQDQGPTPGVCACFKRIFIGVRYAPRRPCELKLRRCVAASEYNFRTDMSYVLQRWVSNQCWSRRGCWAPVSVFGRLVVPQYTLIFCQCSGGGSRARILHVSSVIRYRH